MFRLETPDVIALIVHIHPLDINEEKVVAAAEQFIALGLRDAGYEYINIDVSRDSSGFDLVMLNFTGLLVGTRTKRHWLYCSRL